MVTKGGSDVVMAARALGRGEGLRLAALLLESGKLLQHAVLRLNGLADDESLRAQGIVEVILAEAPEDEARREMK